MIPLSGSHRTVSSVSPFISTCLGPVMMKDVLWIQTLLLNLMCAATKDKLLKLCAEGASSDSTLDVSQGIKDSLELHTACFT